MSALSPRTAVGRAVTATVDDTTGTTVVATMTVAAAARLGCGCVRLTCLRPGPPTSGSGWVNLLTGCGVAPHRREIQP